VIVQGLELGEPNRTKQTWKAERAAQARETFFYFQSSAPAREGQQTEKHGSPSMLRRTDISYIGYFQN
jgi:hypothetical protein